MKLPKMKDMICRTYHKCEKCDTILSPRKINLEIKVKKIGQYHPEMCKQLIWKGMFQKLKGTNISPKEASEWLMCCPECTYAENLNILLQNVNASVTIE